MNYETLGRGFLSRNRDKDRTTSNTATTPNIATTPNTATTPEEVIDEALINPLTQEIAGIQTRLSQIPMENATRLSPELIDMEFSKNIMYYIPNKHSRVASSYTNAVNFKEAEKVDSPVGTVSTFTYPYGMTGVGDNVYEVGSHREGTHRIQGVASMSQIPTSRGRRGAHRGYTRRDLMYTLYNITDPEEFLEMVYYWRVLPPDDNVQELNLINWYVLDTLTNADTMVHNLFEELIFAEMLDKAFDLKRNSQIEDSEYLISWRQTAVRELLGLKSLVDRVHNERRITLTETRKFKASIDKAQRLVIANMAEVDARIANLLDETTPVEQTAFSTDSVANPFLVLDPSVTTASGKLTFRNIARAPATLQTPNIVIPDISQDNRFSPRDVERIPEVQRFLDRTLTDDGEITSPYDAPPESGFNWLPYATAGAVALIVGSQLL